MDERKIDLYNKIEKIVEYKNGVCKDKGGLLNKVNKF